MTQKNKILNMLYKKKWVCTSEMYREYIADPRTTLAQLKKRKITDCRWCQTHKHEGQMKEWTLIGDPHTPVSDLKPQIDLKSFKDDIRATTAQCCASMAIFGIHARDCESLKVKGELF